MRSLYLHIGFGKTGTSSIQSFLSKSKSKLLEFGVLYPSAGLFGDAHHGLADFESERMSAEIELVYYELLKEMEESRAEKIIISSEQFCFVRPDYIERVRELFRGYNVYIIFYVRRQVQLIESTYLQWQKQGRKFDGGIKEFYNAYNHGFDFMLRIQPWVNSFGLDNVIVRVYGGQLVGRNTCLDIARVLGIDSLLPEKSVNENPSLLSDFSKLLNIIDKAADLKGCRQEVVEELLLLTERFRPFSRFKLIDETLQSEIENFYRVSNYNLAMRFLAAEDVSFFLVDD